MTPSEEQEPQPAAPAPGDGSGEAQGFGETRPVDTNRTPTGKAANRRVEFHIVGP